MHCRTFCSKAALGLWVDAFRQLLKMQQQDYGTRFVHDTQEGDASELLQSLLPPLFLYRVTILASLMSCRTPPSLQHWQSVSCRGCKRVVLQCLIRSGEWDAIISMFSHYTIYLSKKCSEQMIRPWPSHDRNKNSGITLPFKDCLQIISVK